MPYLETNGAKLFYEDTGGVGFPLIFIHAGIADHRMWDVQVAAFSPRYRVIRYDTRGFGQSFTEPVRFSNQQDLCDLLDHLGISKAVLIGCSRGGQIALATALEFPERAAALVLVGSGLDGFWVDLPPEEQTRFDELDRLSEVGRLEEVVQLETATWVDGFQRTPDQVDPEVRQRVMEMGMGNLVHASRVQPQPIPLEPPAAQRLGELRIPVLVMVGSLDGTYELAAAERLAEGIAGAKKVILHGTAHVPNMEKPEEFNRALDEFLKVAVDAAL